MEYGFIPDDDCEKPMTNGDRIRLMSDEELADYAYKVLANYCCPPEREYATKTCNDMKAECKKCWLDWLKKESDDEAHG